MQKNFSGYIFLSNLNSNSTTFNYVKDNSDISKSLYVTNDCIIRPVKTDVQSIIRTWFLSEKIPYDINFIGELTTSEYEEFWSRISPLDLVTEHYHYQNHDVHFSPRLAVNQPDYFNQIQTNALSDEYELPPLGYIERAELGSTCRQCMLSIVNYKKPDSNKNRTRFDKCPPLFLWKDMSNDHHIYWAEDKTNLDTLYRIYIDEDKVKIDPVLYQYPPHYMLKQRLEYILKLPTIPLHTIVKTMLTEKLEIWQMSKFLNFYSNHVTIPFPNGIWIIEKIKKKFKKIKLGKIVYQGKIYEFEYNQRYLLHQPGVQKILIGQQLHKLYCPLSIIN